MTTIAASATITISTQTLARFHSMWDTVRQAFEVLVEALQQVGKAIASIVECVESLAKRSSAPRDPRISMAYSRRNTRTIR